VTATCGLPARLLVGARVWRVVAESIGIDGRITGVAWVAAIVVVGLLALALAVSWWPAWRWFRRTPTDALRTE